jgi:hypothetical protein
MNNKHIYFWYLVIVLCGQSFKGLAQKMTPPQAASPKQNCILKAEVLATLIGKNINTQEVKELLKNCSENTNNTNNSLNNTDKILNKDLPIEKVETTMFLSCYEKGVIIETNNEVIEKITLIGAANVQDNNKIKPFKGCLFKNLAFEDNRATTLRKMGKPAMYDDYTLIYHVGTTEVDLVFKKQITKIVLMAQRCLLGDCKNGEGTYLNRNGDKYEGHWKEGVKSGKGTMTYANGDKYEGLWQHDLPHGQGTKTYQNNAPIQKGIWERGVFRGELDLQKEQIFKILGRHKTDSEIRLITDSYGQGYTIIQLRYDHQEYKFNNGRLVLYFDEYGFLLRVDALKNGIFYALPSATKFIKAGTDQKEILNLFGEPTRKKEIIDHEHKHYLWLYEDSIYQQGFYFNAKRIFQSFHLTLMTSPKNLHEKVQGQCLKGDCKEKYGEMVSMFGRYRGNFKIGFFNGKGRLAFTNGGYYNGRFKQNLRHGYGYCQWTDQSSYRGQWRNNVFQGLGTRVYANKDRYEGDWKNGKRNGYGKMKYHDGTIYMGYWKDDLRQGKGIFQQKNGIKKAGKWIYDELIDKQR